MVLAASGETLWHVNRAAAAGGPNAAPIVAATAVADAVVASAAEAVASPPPIIAALFKPFVLVRVFFDSQNYTGGEVLGLSSNGEDQDAAIAVGYLNEVNTNPAVPLPFKFQASTATVTMLNMNNGNDEFDYGRAMAISADGAHITGWAHEVSGDIQAVVWDAPNYTIDKSLSPANGSMWNAIESGGAAAGAYAVSSHTESVMDDGNGPYYPESGYDGVALGINSNEHVCGMYVPTSGITHAYRWDMSTGNRDLHPTSGPYGDNSGANCINDTYDIGGWIESGEYEEAHIPTHWSPTGLPGVYQTNVYGNGEDASSQVVAINSNREMIVNRDDGTVGIAIWTHNSHANEANVIEGIVADSRIDMVLKPNEDDWLDAAFCVNDELWIGGSYRVHNQGGPQPCLVIPYDVDNNGQPDYREIVESGRDGSRYLKDHFVLDWLLDAGENVGIYPYGLRTGLNEPGYSDEYSDDITSNQAVRLPLGIHRPDFENSGDEDFYVNGILDSGQYSQCSDFSGGVEHWAHIDEETGREIVLMLRSNFNDEDPDHDYLPDPSHVDLGQDVTKDDLLTNLHDFAYKFARCVDWIQLGNEAFSSSNSQSIYAGHGGYEIYSDQLSGACWGGGQAREFKDIPMTSSCLSDAIDAVVDWDYDQMWAILEGSALAGRPLRIIGPAVSMDTILSSFEDDSTMGWHVIDRTAAWCNAYQAWFDMHARYLDRDDVQMAWSDLTSGGIPGWSTPGIYEVVCMEMVPRVDDQLPWWTGGGHNRFNAMMDLQHCDASNGDWNDTLIDGWKSAQFGLFNNFALSDVVNNLGGDRITVICYGSTLQRSTIDPLWNLSALRAQNACSENFQNNSEQFSGLRGYWQTAAENAHIPDFNPHPDPCSGCGGN